MKRVRKTKKVTRMKKYRGKRAKITFMSTFKAILRNVLYFLIGLGTLICLIYLAIEKLVIKMIKGMPKWLKRTIILTLIANVVITNNTKAEVIELVKTKTNTIIVEKTTLEKAEVKEETKECTYGLVECQIYAKAIEYGLNDEQAKISIAISKWETGNYTSNLFNNSNNVGGLYNSQTKSFFKYSNIEEGINSFVGNLKRGYFDKGLNTIEEIQKKYCPVGAANDPNNLNCHWVNGVTYFYNQL